MLKKLLITGLVLFALPLAAKAYCLWVPTNTCQDLGDGWETASLPTFCNDPDGNNNKRTEDRNCCCADPNAPPNISTVGCCFSQRESAFISNQAKCETVSGRRLYAPYPVFYISAVNSCIKNDDDCYWVLSASCSNLGEGSWEDDSGAKCAGKKKLVGDTLKCCCGKDVPNPNATDQTPSSTNNTPAQVVGSVRSDYKTLTNPLGPTSWTLSDLPTIIGRVIRAVLSIIGAIALLIFVYGGFVWMTAAGNEAKVAQGKNILLWATIAIIIIFLSWILVAFMFQALGV
jgi:hypothetical protein